MPYGDGTGPNGQGPMTGRGMGFCAGYPVAGFRRGAGRGFGRGFRRMAPAMQPVQQMPIQPIVQPIAKTEEKNILKDELEQIKAEKQEIEKRLKELEA